MFKGDLKTVYAITRCLEVISEASRRLPHDLKARNPAISWKQMAAAGNVYRHDYEHVAAEFVWDTLARALPPLRVVI
ncbi:MAG TPA: HepT-like ribonuclease domain-containing protein [Bradyrhizobium sp.]